MEYHPLCSLKYTSLYIRRIFYMEIER